MSIGIIDVGIGNTGSLSGALYNMGWDTKRISRASDFDDISHLILPGVGSFKEGMFRLGEAGLIAPIKNHAASGKPLLGICLGMQLLASRGDERGLTSGLDLVPGHVRLLDVSPHSRLPHVGWNTLTVTQEHSLLHGVRSDVDFYFVHSYHFCVEDDRDQIGTTNHGEVFSSFVARNNVVGVQFHPEKSQRNGLRILDNFCSQDSLC